MTFFYGVYDAKARRLTYSNAGHNPPVVVRADGSAVRLATGGMVVGLFDHAVFEQDEVPLEPGDRLVLFTDGITEPNRPRARSSGTIGSWRRSSALAPRTRMDCSAPSSTR